MQSEIQRIILKVFGKRPVLTRMQGIVGAGGQIPLPIRLADL